MGHTEKPSSSAMAPLRPTLEGRGPGLAEAGEALGLGGGQGETQE